MGYPGEDFDSLDELTYSRNLLAGDYIRGNEAHKDSIEELKKNLDRKTGDITNFGMTETTYSMLKKLRLKLSLPTVHKTGMSNHFTSIKCSMLFQVILINTSFIITEPMFI